MQDPMIVIKFNEAARFDMPVEPAATPPPSGRDRVEQEPSMNRIRAAVGTVATLAALCGCGGDSVDNTLPQLGAATGASLTSCTDLTTRAPFANTSFTAASAVAAGTLTVAGGDRAGGGEARVRE